MFCFRQQKTADNSSCQLLGWETQGTGWRERRAEKIPAAWQAEEISRVQHSWKGT